MKRQSAPILSVSSNTLLVIFKFVVGIMSGSVSIISEAIHSGLDLVASLVTLISVRQSCAPADKEHPFGHGKFENLSGFFEALLIFLAAGFIVTGAVKKIAALVSGHPIEIEHIGLGVIVMAVSALLNLLVSIKLFSVAKKTGSIAIRADALHLSTDVFTSLGVAAGLVAIHFTGLMILDPIIAIVVAAMILHAAWDLARKSMDDLLDRSLPESVLSDIVSVIESHDMVTSWHKLRTRSTGNNNEVDVHIRVDGTTHIVDAHNLCHEIERAIMDRIGESRITIHVEPQGEFQRMPKQDH